MTAFDQAQMEVGSTADPSLLFAMTALVLLLAALVLYQLWWPWVQRRVSVWRSERVWRRQVTRAEQQREAVRR